MKKKKVSLKDISETLGVSQMTVSRALHGKGGLTEELRLRIVKAAQEMEYMPSRSVRELADAGDSKTVGVVVPHFANTIFPEMIESIDSFLSSNGYRILLCCSYNNSLKEFRDISALLERKVDGIIWSPVMLENSCTAVNMIRKQRCPLVFVDRMLEGVGADAVVVNDRESMFSLVDHLLGQGCRRIGYLNARTVSYVSRERLAGYRDALEKAGVPYEDSLVLNVGSDVAAGRSGIAGLLELPAPPDAAACFNDPLAIGAEMELLARGIPVPGSMAITGFSGVVETELAAVPITTVRQHASELGHEAARLLFSRMINPSFRIAPVRRILKTELQIRKSSLRGGEPALKISRRKTGSRGVTVS